ncbi:MAG: hypothetical protein JNM93_07080 [Bacteriovoracaceae bacterium]|nr:hypothetical protein [Bacteriovoracaceae bacterium]
MHVRKFEGDSLEDVLQTVKKELGPDAIIIKTKTNKGLAGALKKKKIEITAAISETSYLKKAKVDSVLNEEQKERFYKNPASKINATVSNFSDNTPAARGYGNLALNRSVKIAETETKNKTSDLDRFLDEKPANEQPVRRAAPSMALNEFIGGTEAAEEVEVRRPTAIPAQAQATATQPISSSMNDFSGKLRENDRRIKELEDRLMELTQSVTFKNRKDDEEKGILELGRTLRSLDFDEAVIHLLNKNARANLSQKDLAVSDVVFDHALQHLHSLIKTKPILFAEETQSTNGKIVVLISEGSSGQTSMALKLSNIYENCVVIKFSHGASANSRFVEKMFDVEMNMVSTISEALQAIRKASEANKNIIVDYKNISSEVDETKKFVESLSRSYKNLEVELVLSAIHSEIYNRKIISKYKQQLDGVIINHLDKCLSFGSLINVHMHSGQIPMVFFGTGCVVPEDIEAASSERILASLVEL